ncbi:sulfurtransferase [Alkanindiges sp. WGS2144]|uniref:sulfurtransferase n=1 Tax=Alkanindiges sp. WGS2144 TaxID=3366808 RepID=UPI003752A93B
MSSEPIHLPLLIEAEQLLPLLGHPQLRIIDLSRASVHEQVHLPQAVPLQPGLMLRQQGHASGLLPQPEQLQQLASQLGITPQHHIVVYDDEGGAWAGRLIWTLEIMGYPRLSLLNGGIHAWLAQGLPVSSGRFVPESVPPASISINQQPRITLDELKTIVEHTLPGYNLWDCRSLEEYTGKRLAARRGGHLPHAFHYEWTSAVNRQDNLRLHPLDIIRQQLLAHGLDEQKPVIVYCQSHHRSGLAYVIARLLNLPVRAYDGAWSEWGNRLDTPIVTGEYPL